MEKFKESLLSVLPITVLVVVIALSVAKVDGYSIGLFLIGALFLIFGMGLFTLGADVAMMPMGGSIGGMLSKTKQSRFPLVLIIAFVIGFVITLAEPDLHVLAEQLSSSALLYVVAAGVGLFLVVSVLKTVFRIKLTYILLGCYGVVFILGIVVQIIKPEFLAAAFDGGGVTTGPITVPFLMAMGLGLASVRGGKSEGDDSFGMVALCSVGPILAVMILGLSGGASVSYDNSMPETITAFSQIGKLLASGLLHQMKEVALALAPVVAVFFFFQIVSLRLNKSQIVRIIIGIVYTYVGLTIFLTGVNVGFMPMGKQIGAAVASKSYRGVLIPLGMVMGCLIVLAEPAIHVLNKQVEEVTGGAISKKLMLVSLCSGVAVSVGLAMVRVLTGVSIWWFIAPVYGISLLLTFFVPPMFTGIAFDSGGVASGPMTATFLLPMAIGACAEVGGNVFSDAFGLVAFVAMTPLITIQLVGLMFKLKTKHIDRIAVRLAESRARLHIGEQPLSTVDFDKIEHKTIRKVAPSAETQAETERLSAEDICKNEEIADADSAVDAVNIEETVDFD